MALEKPGVQVALGVFAAVATGVGLYLNLSQRPALQSPPAVSADAEPSPATPAPLPEPLVALDESDPLLRERARAIALKPLPEDWLRTEDIARRLAAALSSLGEGRSPRASIGHIGPKKRFLVRKKAGQAFLDPRGYARYDALVSAFVSLDPRAAAVLITDLAPLFDEASRDLGKRRFQADLIAASRELLKTPVVRGEVPLQEKVVSYAFQDPRLEGLSAAQKHLLRMGPDNTEKVQGHLRALLMALGAEPSR